MRRARYDLKQVICKNAFRIGFSTIMAKPGYWVQYGTEGENLGRVLGRIAETQNDGLENCKGWLAVVQLSSSAMSGYIRWVNPELVSACYEKPPHNLLMWLTDSEWVSGKTDIARIIAMSEHGTLQESYIENRKNPDKAYNARPEYINQFILKG